MTSRTAAYGRSAFAWATKRGMVRINPFADLPVAESPTKRERVLSDEELMEVWGATDHVTSPYGSIIRLLILTGQRRGDVAGIITASRLNEAGFC
ncbi:MAG: site-specific integrase, partial [Xanthobacteraceae bacterium]